VASSAFCSAALATPARTETHITALEPGLNRAQLTAISFHEGVGRRLKERVQSKAEQLLVADTPVRIRPNEQKDIGLTTVT